MKYGDPLFSLRPKKIPEGTPCIVEGCDKPIKAKQWCYLHYSRWQRHKDVNYTRIKRYNNALCNLELPTGKRCKNKKYAKDFCAKHYRAFTLYGDPLIVKTAEPSDKTYVPIIAPAGHPNANSNGRILEHRLIMSNYLGRPLRAGENVHHINGDRKDNRLENLELWSTWQPAGQRVEDKVKWALELIAFYAPEKLKDIEND